MTNGHAGQAGLLEGVPLPALLVGPSKHIVATNSEARDLLGKGIDTRHFATILRQPQLVSAIETCLSGQQPQVTTYQGTAGAQDTRFEVTCRYVMEAGAASRGAVMVVFRDVTDLATAGQMRRDFVANVSHELRTPLTALTGFIETLRGPARDDAAARDRFLAIMQAEAGRMNRLIGDLLSLSRLERDGRVRPNGRVDLCGAIESTLRGLGPVAAKRGVTLDWQPPADPVEITGDGDQIRQVLTNLIENAIKYGREGGTVSIRLAQSDHDQALRRPAVHLSVTDDGPGIDPVHLPRLTERFYRVDSHRSRGLGGTGLGLAIVKHIVNRHRGRLKIASNVGEGSVFTVILPI